MAADYPIPLEQNRSRRSWLTNFLMKPEADKEPADSKGNWLLRLVSIESNGAGSAGEGFWWHHSVGPEDRTINSGGCQLAEFIDDTWYPMDYSHSYVA